MKYFFLLFVLLAKFSDAQNLQDYKIRPIEFNKVKLSDKFWLPRIETNKVETIPTSFARCENTGRIKNFEMAATKTGKFCTTFVFDDTDIYKTIEGASYSLAVYPDKKLENYIDSLIVVIANAQEPDGYLYTARTINPPNPPSWSGKERWVNEGNMSHELYNSGHLIESAVAHYQATGKKNLLNIAIKNANLLVATFGTNKRSVAPGHEIIEMALVRLYRVTANENYLNLAKFFINQRGIKKYDTLDLNPWKNGAYWQDNLPVVNQNEAVGHAVRAMYLYAGVADVAALTGDEKYLNAIDKIWENMCGKKMYVNGGIGAVPDGERFGNNYELPNATAYNETCAAIGNVYWNQRMFLLHGSSKYIDVMEKVMYNALLSGVGLDGKTFFYTNAMQIFDGPKHKDVEPGRSGWFECSCCPTNMSRFLPSLSGYIYAQTQNQVYVNLYVASSTDLLLGNKSVKITQKNNYPWEGHLNFDIEPEEDSDFALKLRLPGWAVNQAIPSDLYKFQSKSNEKFTVKLNGKALKYTLNDGYITIQRVWKRGDKVELVLPMEIKKVLANQKLTDDIGKVSVQRGPITFCAESTDNTAKISEAKIPSNSDFKYSFNSNLLSGVAEIKGNAITKSPSGNEISVPFKLIPYYAWANRTLGEMSIWFPVYTHTK
ncbi:glycoside hydrolase family 127 protein [Pedobacter aquatilis]|uniref:glycoside hydrolase family 127 protein n=1 Tax=Pedobacter aquatilis TaxID=351343 RepID=UPI0025B59E0C|nr:glycoside hydrolase family 127 protein [Pedobacter aquatilis]MDN3587574.1 glycoside hydrolase family 127 protein [Pedobacter aquatilis]